MGTFDCGHTDCASNAKLARACRRDRIGPHCPWCRSADIEAEFVDVGVGSIQATPYQCNNCEARQFYDTADAANASEDERLCGWWKGRGR